MSDLRVVLEWLSDDSSTAILAWPNGSKYIGMVTKDGEREG